jgi:hypothetical protein
MGGVAGSRLTVMNQEQLQITSEKGELLYILSGDIFDKPTRETIHI